MMDVFEKLPTRSHLSAEITSRLSVWFHASNTIATAATSVKLVHLSKVSSRAGPYTEKIGFVKVT